MKELQERMFRLVTRRTARPEDPPLVSWIAASDEDRAADRLGVYAGMHRQRLLDVLAEDFPETKKALGEAFEETALRYLERHPSTDPSLRNLGARFPDFVGTERARLERARVEAIDAADAEPLRRETLADLAPEKWSSFAMALVPSARLVGDTIVWRRGFDVCERAVEPHERAALARLLSGCTFGEACEAFGETPERIRSALELWLVDELVMAR